MHSKPLQTKDRTDEGLTRSWFAHKPIRTIPVYHGFKYDFASTL